jgi:hypothetical protein
MFRYLKVITILVCVVATNNAVACKRGQSAMNQNGSEAVVAQLRQSWKNFDPKRVAAPVEKPHAAAKRGKARSAVTQVKHAARS